MSCPPPDRMGNIVVPPEAEAFRLDVFVAEQAGLTRSQAAKLIEEGLVSVDGRMAGKAGLKLSAGSEVCWQVPCVRPMELTPEPLPLTILYEDADLAVVCKPNGMVVHPAAGNEAGTLVHALLYHLRDLSGVGGVARPGIVHRLDKDTSGLLLVAKNDAAHQALSEQLKARTMCKLYGALAAGGFSQAQGKIDAPIGRDPKDRKRMAVVQGGRGSVTEYHVAGRVGKDSLVCLRLITGRTHQIRVHLRSIGHSVLGDSLYGGKRAVERSRLMLHAYKLAFAQPTTGKRVIVTAPWPADFLQNLHNHAQPDEIESLSQALDGFETICESFLKESF
ncbi:MAG: RluA family pseudouridine synthase [Clostridia bacterium]|nr:RluA family pseudouridine synthase [Clostridia bacterium]